MPERISVKLSKPAYDRLRHEAIDRNMRIQDLLDKILKDWFWSKDNIPDPPWEEGK